MKKVNPRKRPVTEADLRKATMKASDQAVHIALAIFLTVLVDKFDFNNDEVVAAWEAMDKLSQEIAERRVSKEDLTGVLLAEYNIDLR